MLELLRAVSFLVLLSYMVNCNNPKYSDNLIHYLILKFNEVFFGQPGVKSF